MKNKILAGAFSSLVESKPFIFSIVATVLLLLVLPVDAQLQPPRALEEEIQLFETVAEPQAVVISVRGECTYSGDGIAFTRLKNDQIFKQGAVIRTGEDARVDIFFRRIGTTVRLQPGSEIKIEKMARQMKDGNAVMQTLLDLRKGRIFTVVRAFVAGSTFEIRNAAGRSVVEGGGGKGRYIITADGTQVTEKNSDIPLKVIGDKGVTIITPGQKFLANEGKLLPLDTSEAVLMLIEVDEIHSLVEKWEQPETSKESSGQN